jgi:MFS family permease
LNRKYGLADKPDTVTADLSANIVSTLQAGCFAGALLASPLAEKMGRRSALLISALISIVGTVMQAAASGQLAVMYVGR